MASPSVVSQNDNNNSSSSTSHSVSLPASIVSGNLLVAAFVIDTAATVTWPAGWTQFGTDETDSESRSTGSVAYRVADGSESSSITVTTSNSQTSSGKTWQVSGHIAPATQAPEVVWASGPLSGSTQDPPSITPTGGSKDYLFLIFTGNQRGNTTTGFPANYTTGSNDSPSDPSFAWGHRQLTASSEDPGAFTTDTDSAFVAATMAIHPDSASDTTAPTLTSASGTSTGTSTADGSVSTDEDNGTLYWIVDQSSTAPLVAQIQAGQDNGGVAADDSGNQEVSATGTQNFSSTGLAASTTYYVHAQHKDTAGNDSTVVSSTSFTTAAASSTILPLLNAYYG